MQVKHLKIDNLNYSYDQEDMILAVNDVSFKVEAGHYVSIIGHNGSGKSTLAKLLIGLIGAQSGVIQIDDLVLNEETVYEFREKIAIVFQNPDNQFIGSTVRDDIAFGLENRCVDPKQMDGIIENYAERVGMSDYLNHEPTKLSGGQKQRVAIAGALAMHPEVLILDEATSMLDPRGRQEVNDLVRELHQKHKMTILSITHDIEEVAMSDSVLVMHQGRIAMYGTPEAILKRYDELVALSLDVPFALKVQLALQDKGIEVNSLDGLEGMVETLCTLNSKK